MKIGLLGGSFDPIHKGHIEIAKNAISKLDLDKFYFIPTKNNPWKDKSFSSDLDRIQMIEIAIRNHEKMSVSRVEIDSESNDKNYTYYTLLKLKEMYKNDELYFIIGMDQVISFHKWFKALEISQMVQLVAFDRGGYKEDSENLKNYQMLKIDGPVLRISSTDIRNGVLSGIDKNVLSYAVNKGIYIDTMIKPYMKEKRYQHSLSVASLTREFCVSNNEDGLKGYIAGIFHDVAKEMDYEKSKELMNKYYSDYINTPVPIWHQWLSAYVAKNTFLIEDKEILKAIEDHTTGSTTMSQIGKCLYCADKLDPLRGYDSSDDIKLCMKDIDEGFKKSLISFYEFSSKNNRSIDPIFYDIYKKYVEVEDE